MLPLKNPISSLVPLLLPWQLANNANIRKPLCEFSLSRERPCNVASSRSQFLPDVTGALIFRANSHSVTAKFGKPVREFHSKHIEWFDFLLDYSKCRCLYLVPRAVVFRGIVSFPTITALSPRSITMINLWAIKSLLREFNFTVVNWLCAVCYSNKSECANWKKKKNENRMRAVAVF